MYGKVFFLLLFYLSTNLAYNDGMLRLGGLFYEDSEDLSNVLKLSATQSELFEVAVELIPRGQVLQAGEKVCSLAESKVIGIIDGTEGRASEHIQAICDMLELPHILVQPNDFQNPDWFQLNLYPSDATYNLVLEEIIKFKEWHNFTILYVRGRTIKSMENIMKMDNDHDRYVATVRELSGDDYRDVLTNAKESGFTNFVVDCPFNRLEQFLSHAQQVGLMADEYSYIFLSPDLFNIDLSPFRYGGVNITGFQLVDMKKAEEMFLQLGIVETKLFLVADAVQVFIEAIKKVNVTMEELSCQNYKPWIYGSSLLNFMRTNKFEGFTRVLNFDEHGQRIDVNFDILELTPAGNQTIGKWKNNKFLVSRSIISSGDLNEESIMINKTFKVLISTTPPYGFLKESKDLLIGNDRFEGFTIDLISEIANILGFNYEFEEEADYGAYSETTKKWSGMVQKIREDKADFGICDFTITASRQSAIDFSTPFMTLGIGILYKEPSKQPPEMFSFMAVFSTEVWINMLLVQIGLGVIMIFVGRISHKEWQNPVPCIEQPEELKNQFSFANSIWLIFGSVMQQGTEIAPIALSTRLITSIWWFFTMVMVASYTGTLVAFLTVESKIMPFNNIEELAKQKSISYGAKGSGSTILFFSNSTNPLHKMMYNKMMENKWLVRNNDIGVAIAENTTYAFFMESTSIEYTNERHCDLRQVGGLLDSKSYGIGMKQGSPYKKYIDNALLRLKEAGKIQKLKDIWWKEKRGGGKCENRKNEETKELGMKNMIGAFVVLGMGCIIGLMISTLDMLWGVFKRTVKYKTTFRYELVEELKFALKFSGDIKPVKRPDRPAGVEGSVEALAEIVAKEEVRSVLSTDTHRTHHSHSTRHSSRSQSVAFARRRQYS